MTDRLLGALGTLTTELSGGFVETALNPADFNLHLSVVYSA